MKRSSEITERDFAVLFGLHAAKCSTLNENSSIVRHQTSKHNCSSWTGTIQQYTFFMNWFIISYSIDDKAIVHIV